MAFCGKCGAQAKEGAAFCASCGAATTATPQLPRQQPTTPQASRYATAIPLSVKPDKTDLLIKVISVIHVLLLFLPYFVIKSSYGSNVWVSGYRTMTEDHLGAVFWTTRFAFIVPIVIFALLSLKRKLPFPAVTIRIFAAGLSFFGILFNIMFTNSVANILLVLPGVVVKAGPVFYIIILLYLIIIALAALGFKKFKIN